MGHLINPITNRLSINTFWNSTWSLVNNFNYINVFKKDYILFQFLNWFTKKSKFGKFNVIISHYKVYRIYKNIFINFYYYNAGIEEKKYRFQISFLVNLLRRKRKFWNKRTKQKSIVTRFKRIMYRTSLSGKQLSRTFLFKQKNTLNKFATAKIKSLYVFFIKIVVSNIYWGLLNNSLSFYLSKLYSTPEKYYFNIYNLDFLNVTTDIISTYISLRLQQKYSLNWVLRPILKDLSTKIKKHIFLGYKIVCSGRFTRKQIATYMWMKQGSLQLNTFTNLVKYSESSVRLKYGLCGIKVWLSYGRNDLTLFKRNILLIYPMYTPFKYLIDYKKNCIIFHLNYWFYLYIKVVYLKSKFYKLYSFFISVKAKVVVKYLLKKVFKQILHKNFNILYLGDNKIAIELAHKKLFFTKLINKNTIVS
jgi:ribosomal protein S3